jgi:hypothetical protein
MAVRVAEPCAGAFTQRGLRELIDRELGRRLPVAEGSNPALPERSVAKPAKPSKPSKPRTTKTTRDRVATVLRKLAATDRSLALIRAAATGPVSTR